MVYVVMAIAHRKLVIFVGQNHDINLCVEMQSDAYTQLSTSLAWNVHILSKDYWEYDTHLDVVEQYKLEPDPACWPGLSEQVQQHDEYFNILSNPKCEIMIYL